jgi:TIGR03009 family protein
MRSRGLSLAALILGCSVTVAQQAAPPPPPVPQQGFDPVNNRLDAILFNWERAMSSINSLHAQVMRIAEDKVFNTKEVYVGEAKYLKPNKASLYLQNQDPKKPDYEKLVCNGQIAYKWEPSKKEIQVYEMPKPKQGQINDDNFVSWFFGMKATDAKVNYELQLLPEPENAETKGLYYYISVLPKTPQAKSEFTDARLVLTSATFLPRQLSFKQPNGNTTTWDFPRLATNLQVDQQQFAREFIQPQPPQGWQLKKILSQDPRVVRQQQK